VRALLACLSLCLRTFASPCRPNRPLSRIPIGTMTAVPTVPTDSQLPLRRRTVVDHCDRAHRSGTNVTQPHHCEPLPLRCAALIPTPLTVSVRVTNSQRRNVGALPRRTSRQCTRHDTAHSRTPLPSLSPPLSHPPRQESPPPLPIHPIPIPLSLRPIPPPLNLPHLLLLKLPNLQHPLQRIKLHSPNPLPSSTLLFWQRRHDHASKEG